MEKAESASKVTAGGEKLVGTLRCFVSAWSAPKEVEVSEQDAYIVKFRPIKQDISCLSTQATGLKRNRFTWDDAEASLDLLHLEGMLKITLIKLLPGKSAEESNKLASTQVALNRICDLDAAPDSKPNYFSLDLANEEGRYGSLGVKFKFEPNTE